MIKSRQQQKQQYNGQQHSKKRKQQRLAKKLCDQVAPGRSYNLSHTYLFGTFNRTCRSQVHEIDTGDNEDKYGYLAEYFYIFNSTGGWLSVNKNIVQVLVAERLKANMVLNAFWQCQLRL